MALIRKIKSNVTNPAKAHSPQRELSTVEQLWIDFAKTPTKRLNSAEYYKEKHPFKYKMSILKDYVQNYIKQRLGIEEETNRHNELIGISKP